MAEISFLSMSIFQYELPVKILGFNCVNIN